VVPVSKKGPRCGGVGHWSTGSWCGERAALELLAFEHRTRTSLVAERHELGKTLNAIAGSRVWKAAQLARRVLRTRLGKAR